MMPGVTNFPLPSITTAPAGAPRCCPTALILPSTISTSLVPISLSVAVRTVAPRISVGWEGRRLYVEGKLSLGNWSAPCAPSDEWCSDGISHHASASVTTTIAAAPHNGSLVLGPILTPPARPRVARRTSARNGRGLILPRISPRPAPG